MAEKKTKTIIIFFPLNCFTKNICQDEFETKKLMNQNPGEKYTFELPKTSIKMFDTLEKILLVGSKDKRHCCFPPPATFPRISSAQKC